MTQAANFDSDEEIDDEELMQINEDINEEGASPDFKGGRARLVSL